MSAQASKLLHWYEPSAGSLPPLAQTLFGLVAAVLFALGLALFSRQLRGDWGSLRARALTLMTSMVLLGFIYAALPLKLAKGLEASTSSPEVTQAPEGTAARLGLMTAEHGKAVEEIKMRLEQGDSWFHKKFILVGAVFGVLVGAFGVETYVKAGGRKNGFHSASLTEEAENRLAEMAGTNITCSVLAVAMVVGIAIDQQTRQSDITVQQLGLWIRHCVEPASLGEPTLEGTDGDLGPSGFDQAVFQGYIGWERFVRLPGIAMHTDAIYKFTAYPHGNVLTWLIYGTYLICFQWICLRASARGGPALSREQAGLALGIFFFVHFCLGIYAFISHTAPEAFYLTVFRWNINGQVCGLLFLLPWLLLVLVNTPYWRMLWNQSPLTTRDTQRP